MAGGGNRIEMTGQRFGRLVVIRYDGSQNKWICHCDCGNTNYATKSFYLRHGKVVSCGCRQRLHNIETMPDIALLNPLDVAWLAGIMDGEGSFYTASNSRKYVADNTHACFSLRMTDQDTIERAAKITQAVVGSYVLPSGKDCFMFRLNGTKALAWMRILYEHMSIRRKAAIDLCFEIEAKKIQNKQ